MRLSHSQVDIFTGCQRQYFYSYIKKIPVITDTRHLRRGSLFHNIAQWIVNEKPEVMKVKERFEIDWKKHRLDVDFNEKKDETYLMLLNFYNDQPSLTSTELKIYQIEPNFVSYLDGVHTTDDIIIDYKTSTWSNEYSKLAYKDQMGRYALMYYKKFNRLPKKCVVWFVKYAPIRKVEYEFNMEDIQNYEKEIVETNDFIEKNKNNEKVFKKCITEGRECNFFCPYKNLCLESGEDVLKYTLRINGNNIFLDGPITDLLNKGLHKKFSYELKDAYFIKKANPHINTIIDFWNERQRILPLAMKDALVKTLTDYSEYKQLEIAIDIEDQREFDDTVIKMPEKFINGKELRDYQSDAVDVFLRNKISMLELATGAGKSLIVTEIIRKLGVKTLILVNRLELLKQFKGVIEETLGIKVGVIGRGEEDIQPITIATVQTIYKNIKKYESYLQSVRFSVMDECHNVNHLSYYRISKQLINTEYRIGVSGTARRNDGNTMYLNAVNGYICYSLNADKLIENGWLMRPQITFIKDFLTKEEVKEKEGEIKTGLINESEDYMNVYRKFILEDSKRNDIIKKLVEKNKDRKILILVKLVEHGKNLSELLNVPYLFGGTKKDERDKLMEDFKEGNLNVLIGTLSIFSEGLDIPALQVLINASGQKSDIKSVQVLGRLLRKKEGKTNCIYYDFIDKSRLLGNASRSRKKSFRDEGHEVIVKDNI